MKQNTGFMSICDERLINYITIFKSFANYFSDSIMLDLAYSILMIGLAVVLFYTCLTWNHSYWKKRGIAYEKPTPIFGNLFQVFLGNIPLGLAHTNIYRQVSIYVHINLYTYLNCIKRV